MTGAQISADRCAPPSDGTHDCFGCGTPLTGDAPLCDGDDGCMVRYAVLGAREYPDLSSDDAAWLDRTDDAMRGRL